MILGLDDAVGRAALAGDVPTRGEKDTWLVTIFFRCLVRHCQCGRQLGAPFTVSQALWPFGRAGLQVDKLAALVLHFDGCGRGEEEGVGGGSWAARVAVVVWPCLFVESLSSPGSKSAVGFARGKDPLWKARSMRQAQGLSCSHWLSRATLDRLATKEKNNWALEDIDVLIS